MKLEDRLPNEQVVTYLTDRNIHMSACRDCKKEEKSGWTITEDLHYGVCDFCGETRMRDIDYHAMTLGEIAGKRRILLHGHGVMAAYFDLGPVDYNNRFGDVVTGRFIMKFGLEGRESFIISPGSREGDPLPAWLGELLACEVRILMARRPKAAYALLGWLGETDFDAR